MSERKTFFANILIPVPVHEVFTYRIPFEMNEHVLFGQRVIVPFGKSKLQTGIIVEIHERIPKNYQAKYIEYLLDDEPIITNQQFKLWKWISSYYMAPLGDVMNASLPANFKLSSETVIILHPDFDGSNYDSKDEKSKLIIDSLEVKEKLNLKEISELLGIKTVQPIIKKLIENNTLISQEALKERYTPKTVSCYQVAETFKDTDLMNDFISSIENKLQKKKQLDSLLILINESSKINDAVLKKTLLEKGANLSSLMTLEKNGIIEATRKKISRIQNQKQSKESIPNLSKHQKKAYLSIKNHFADKMVCLLHGVTGSGKTTVYIHLIEEQLKKGKQVLYLIPEIALTTQLITRLSIYFGEQIGVYHSRFNQNERIEIWNNVLRNNKNKYRIIIGARSAVFLPYHELGLIIIDEEHENTFKQTDPSPRYHGRDVSLILAQQQNAKVLLGTATPSFESYSNAINNKFGLVELHERYQEIKMPLIELADMKQEKKENTLQSHFSSKMIEAIKTSIDNKEQIILFQNRRGYNPLWSCEVCSWTPHCKQCDISLTYHKHSNTLKCHYCSYTIAPMGSCKECGSNRINMIGFGTEKIEDELGLIFPELNIQRLDYDTTKKKNAYETILNDFDEGKINVLIGTQMVTKGLDFNNVGLVGILDADMLLNRPDFRAFERSFQLMVQVAGRAGRKNKQGKVIIQTRKTDHWVIDLIKEHNYKKFFNIENTERKNFFYPPYYKIINLTLRHKDEKKLSEAAQLFTDKLKESYRERVIGPQFPLVKRIQNYYLKIIKIKYEKTISDQQLKKHLQSEINGFYKNPDNRSIRISIDVDPL